MNVENRHVYDYDVDLTGQNAAVYVMQLVGQSKRVLEIGCGPGSITKLLARHGQCSVTALELNPGRNKNGHAILRKNYAS